MIEDKYRPKFTYFWEIRSRNTDKHLPMYLSQVQYNRCDNGFSIKDFQHLP